MPGEGIEAEGVARFFFSDGSTGIWPEVHIFVTTSDRLLWALVEYPDVAMSMEFEQLTRLSREGPLVALTEADPEYAAAFQDSTNPLGETDAVFDFSQRAARKVMDLIVKKAVEAGL